MKKMSHLDISELLAYADPALKDEAREKAKAHIETCGSCRARFISLQTLRASLNTAPENIVAHKLTDNCVPEELMGDFLGNRLPEAERAIFSEHTKECDICFERAAYFTWSSANMAAGVLDIIGQTPERYKAAVLNRSPEPQTTADPKPSIWETFGRWISSPAPAYAFAASLLIFMLFWTPNSSDQIIDIGSNGVFSLYEQPKQSGPSFGFSDSGRKLGESDAGLSVEKTNDGRIRFSWSKVEGAEGYNFHLAEITPAGAKDIFDTKTTETFIVAPRDLTSPGKAYRWKVSGETESNTIFTAQGQFAFSR